MKPTSERTAPTRTAPAHVNATQEALKDVAERAVAQLSEQLLAESPGALQRHLAHLARLRQYSYMNMLLIEHQAPGTRQAAPKSVWDALGRELIPDARAIQIWVPGPALSTSRAHGSSSAPHAAGQGDVSINVSRDDVSQNDVSQNDVSQNDVTAAPAPQGDAPQRDDRPHRGGHARFLLGTVYAVEDTTGPELPHNKALQGNDLPLLRRAAKASPFKLQLAPTVGACQRQDDVLCLDLPALGSIDEGLNRLLQCWADTLLSSAPGPDERTCESQMVACVLLSGLGLEPLTPLAARALYGGRPKKLRNALKRVQAASRTIFSTLDTAGVTFL